MEGAWPETWPETITITRSVNTMAELIPDSFHEWEHNSP